MIEREFVREKIKHLKIKELVEKEVNKYAGIGDIIVEKTPLGEKITIYAVRPGLVIGSGGETVKKLTTSLKSEFALNSPQLKIQEILEPNSWASVVAKKIASDFERFGPGRYKAAGYRALSDIIRAGARGAEIRITGVGIPGARARSWRFFAGYLKKSGDTAETAVDKAYEAANLRRGTLGIKVMIMPKGIVLPDDVKIKFEKTIPEVAEIKSVKEAGKVIVEKKKASKKEKESKAKDKSEAKTEVKKKVEPVKKEKSKKKKAVKLKAKHKTESEKAKK